MSSNFYDLTCSEPRGIKRPASTHLRERARKRDRRGTSTTSTTSSRTSDRNQASSTGLPQHVGDLDGRRYPGDGLDCRRPAATDGSWQHPIDLSDSDEDVVAIDVDDTSTFRPFSRPASRPPPQLPSQRQHPTRGPRYSAQIINVDERGPDDGRSAQLQAHHAAAGANPTSRPQLPPFSELDQFRSHPPTRQSTPGWHHSRSGRAIFHNNTFQPPPDAEIFVINDDNEDGNGGVVIEDNRGNRIRDQSNFNNQIARNQASGRPLLSGIHRNNTPQTRAQLLQQHRQQQLQLHAARQAHQVPPAPRQAGAFDFIQPVLSYAGAAWNYYRHAPPVEPVRDPTPQAPAYDPLPPVAEGFTRSPGQGEILVCPRCRKELCVDDEVKPDSSSEEECKGPAGSTSARGPAKGKKPAKSNEETRQEVWVVKACGHVYCGTCARSRKAPSKAPPKKAKGKQKETSPPPFSFCTVHKCGEKVSGKSAMIQLFL